MIRLPICYFPIRSAIKKFGVPEECGHQQHANNGSNRNTRRNLNGHSIAITDQIQTDSGDPSLRNKKGASILVRAGRRGEVGTNGTGAERVQEKQEQVHGGGTRSCDYPKTRGYVKAAER